MDTEQRKHTFTNEQVLENGNYIAQKNLILGDVDVLLLVGVISDANGKIQDAGITPMQTLKDFKSFIPNLMKYITDITKPTVPFTYTLPTDIDNAYALYQKYSTKTEAFYRRINDTRRIFVDTLIKIDLNLFIKNWWLKPQLQCVDIGNRVLGRFTAISEEATKAAKACNQYMSEVSRGMSNASSSSILVVAPTLAAIMSNEVTIARFNAKVDEMRRKLFVGYAMGIDVHIALQKLLSADLPQILKEGLNEVLQSYIRECIEIKGTAAEKIWWKKLKEFPTDVESYVSVLENADRIDADELRNVATYFEIDNTALKESCLTKLRSRTARKTIMSDIGKKDIFITNVCNYFKIDEGELVASIYADFINEIKEKLCVHSKHLSNDAIAGIKNSKKPHDVAQECIRAIVSPDDFVLLCEIAKEQLLQPLTEVFSIDKKSTTKDVYISMIAYVEKKLTAAKKILDDTNRQIDELNCRKAEYENMRQHAGLFAFSKKKAAAAQISEVENQIIAAESACQQRLNEL